MSSILKVDTIQDQSGNNIINESGNVITIGASGDTITVPAGATVSGFTSAGIDDNATSVAITINSSEQVGIGTTSPDTLLSLEKNNAPIIQFKDTSGATDEKIWRVNGLNDAYRIQTWNDALNSNQVAYQVLRSGVDVTNHRFYTEDSERMRLTTTGLGIGTTSPSRQLTVSGSTAPVIAIVDTGTSGTPSLFFGDSSADNVGKIQYSNSDNSLATLVNGSERMRILSDGKVGIGTSSPSEELEVSGSQTTIIKSKTTTTTALSGVEVHNSTGTSYLKVFQLGPSFGGTTFGGVTGNNQTLIEAQEVSSLAFTTQGGTPDIIFAPARTARMTIKNGGNVGIGTASPGTKLEVVGTGVNGIELGEQSDGNDSSRLFFTNSSNVCAIRSSGGSLKFSTGATINSSSGDDRVIIHSNGVMSAANGIALGVGANNTASNVLDDYEEGTWSPKLGNETTAVYSNQTGWYRKIGETVFIYFSVSLSSKGDISGAYTKIANLPFNGASGGDRFGSGQIHAYRLGSSAHIQGIEFGGATVSVGWIMTGGGGTTGYLNTSFVADNTYFEGFAMYKTA